MLRKRSSLDTLTAAQRSERMSRVRGKDTMPELRVRRTAHSLGFRYRLHGKGLPGHPDLVFASKRKVVFVHGCFWHRHRGCAKTRFPKSPERAAFWRGKLLGNARRDHRNQRELEKSGWKTLVIWECETDDFMRLRTILNRFLR